MSHALFWEVFFFFLYYFPGPDQSISSETLFLSLESRQILDIHNGGRVFFSMVPPSPIQGHLRGVCVKKQDIGYDYTIEVHLFFYMLGMAS